MGKTKSNGKRNGGKKRKGVYGEGSVYPLPGGMYGGAIRYIDPDTGNKRRKYFRDKDEEVVIKLVNDFKENQKKGILPTADKITVGQWLDMWAETYAKFKVRQNTFEGYNRVINSHLKPSIGNFKLQDLQPQQVQQMLNTKLIRGRLRNNNDKNNTRISKGGPLSPRMVEYIYSVLHMALERAVRNKLVSRNVCDDVDKPKKEKHEFIPWTTKETNIFLSKVKNTRLFPVYMIAWGAGLRRSEILGLKWEDIDLDNGTLSVKRTLVRVKGGYTFGEPKTKKSRRTIPLPIQVIDILRTWKKSQAIEEMKWRSLHKEMDLENIPKYNPLKLVFCTEIGEPLKPDYVSTTFKRALLNAGLPLIRFHDLRHGHATMLLELKLPLKVISDRLGHSSINITADTYSHVTNKLEQEACHALESVLDLQAVM